MPDQAIVVIHGMGEQRPMDFLRGFVRVVAPSGKDVFSQPNPLSESFELRRMRVLASKTRRPTFLYEYYWAHHMKGSNVRHLRPLVRRVFLRRPWKVSGSLQLAYWLTWALAAFLAWRFADFLVERLTEPSSVWRDFVVDFGLSPSAAWAVLLVLGLLEGAVVNYFGDVARYLDPKPGNVDIRQTIRAEGIALLKKVNKEHDRVIVVGHSLGSVIALDLLSHMWSHDYYYDHAKNAPETQPALDALEALGPHLEPGARLEEFRARQHALWKEQIRGGSPWKVSDFVSVGSPLAHAKLLLASKKLSVDELQTLRELPRCPPVRDTEGVYSYLPGDAGERRRLHHAAHFAFTRWTNIWFPSRWGVLGDWFAGPVAPVFGPGVHDVSVTNGVWGRFPIVAHTSYFKGRQRGRSGRRSSIEALREALDLEHSA